MRAALIKLFEEPVPESYKAGREVLHSILGRDVVIYDRPILCFNTNKVLVPMITKGVTPVVWETKERLESGCKSILAESPEHAGHQLLMEFIGM